MSITDSYNKYIGKVLYVRAMSEDGYIRAGLFLGIYTSRGDYICFGFLDACDDYTGEGYLNGYDVHYYTEVGSCEFRDE